MASKKRTIDQPAMTQISVSVKKNAGAPNVPFKADSAKETPPKKLILNKKFFWLVLLIILAGETGTLVFLLSKKLNDLEKIMPQNAAAIISLKKDPTEKIFFSFKNKNWLWPPVNDLSKNIQDFLAQNKINFENHRRLLKTI